MQDVSENIRLYSISETARKMNVSKQTIYDLISTGKLSYLPIGKRMKIPHIAIRKYINVNLIKKQSAFSNSGLSTERLENTSTTADKYFNQLRKR